MFLVPPLPHSMSFDMPQVTVLFVNCSTPQVTLRGPMQLLPPLLVQLTTPMCYFNRGTVSTTMPLLRCSVCRRTAIKSCFSNIRCTTLRSFYVHQRHMPEPYFSNRGETPWIQLFLSLGCLAACNYVLFLSVRRIEHDDLPFKWKFHDYAHTNVAPTCSTGTLPRTPSKYNCNL